MPRISAFYGIVIYIYGRNHAPPHVHAEYGDREALIVIADGRVFAGSLPPRALRLVREWRRLHLDELQQAWELASRRQDPGTIEPLPLKKIEKIPRVTNVEVRPPYGLRLTFDDGLTRDVDLAGELWGAVFEPLRDPAFFAEVFVEAPSPGRMASTSIRWSFTATSSRRRPGPNGKLASPPGWDQSRRVAASPWIRLSGPDLQ